MNYFLTKPTLLKMKVLKFMGLAIVVMVSIAVVGITIESDVHVERTITIEAKTKKILKHLIDFRKFNAWSAWIEYDSNCKCSYSEKRAIVGATYKWKGNEEVGVGSMAIIEISRTKVAMDLIYTEPWQSESVVYDRLDDGENGIDVTWDYNGKIPMLRVLFIDIDTLIGSDYEKGLRSLKEILE